MLKISGRAFPLVLVAALAVLWLAIGAAPAAAADAPYTIDDNHDLADESAIGQYERTGEASGDADTLDVRLTVSEHRHHVGMQPSGVADLYNDAYLRIKYEESAARTLRIYIPREYWVPYQREQVESLTSDHVASYEPIEGGDYTEVVIEFDGEGDIVLPARRYATIGTGWSIDRADEYLNQTTGHSLRSEPGEWQYIRSDQLAEGPGIKLPTETNDVLVQYDATPDEERETWVNAPKGSANEDGVYYYVKHSENGTMYVISENHDPPAVRYKERPRLRDTWKGRFNDLEYSLKSTIGSWFGGGDDDDSESTEGDS